MIQPQHNSKADTAVFVVVYSFVVFVVVFSFFQQADTAPARTIGRLIQPQNNWKADAAVFVFFSSCVFFVVVFLFFFVFASVVIVVFFDTFNICNSFDYL